eukprot:933194-Alexandrium_andersonii.AAC.1
MSASLVGSEMCIRDRAVPEAVSRCPVRGGSGADARARRSAHRAGSRGPRLHHSAGRSNGPWGSKSGPPGRSRGQPSCPSRARTPPAPRWGPP